MVSTQSPEKSLQRERLKGGKGPKDNENQNKALPYLAAALCCLCLSVCERERTGTDLLLYWIAQTMCSAIKQLGICASGEL